MEIDQSSDSEVTTVASTINYYFSLPYIRRANREKNINDFEKMRQLQELGAQSRIQCFFGSKAKDNWKSFESKWSRASNFRLEENLNM